MNGGIGKLRKTSGSLAALLVAGALAAGTAQAAPVYGVFVSEEFGGDIMDGRWSASLPEGNTGDVAQIGSVINAASWDGVDLGTQWEMSGQELVARELLSVEPFGNLRIEKWALDYDNGTLLLKKYARGGAISQWWGDEPVGAEEYVVTIGQYSHNTQITYLYDEIVGVYSIITLSGTFQEYPNWQMEFMLAVAVELGEGAAPPANYPEFLFPGWYENPVQWGQWGVAQKIKMQITPEPSALGLLGLGGVLVVLRRRRRRK
jgi:hypothetical protein